MSIPVYSYILFIILTYFVESNEEISINIQDIFKSIGIIINISISIYYIYITKFLNIYLNIKSNINFKKRASQKYNINTFSESFIE